MSSLTDYWHSPEVFLSSKLRLSNFRECADYLVDINVSGVAFHYRTYFNFRETDRQTDRDTEREHRERDEMRCFIE